MIKIIDFETTKLVLGLTITKTSRNLFFENISNQHVDIFLLFDEYGTFFRVFPGQTKSLTETRWHVGHIGLPKGFSTSPDVYWENVQSDYQFYVLKGHLP